ncbi:hypothetical protein PMG11_08471 [Penicillium brasilianum]|uniref:MINDY deubiquitinase domain-containing protein n=1 Tax=Penicillium brasilianum TaxID=104259 RepID=A0A0F7TWU9_PENBI|nr:hypothetical protein PMG11_08471 [Penicillium brasilianum]
MVLRKPPPPRLENLHKWNARAASPTSPSTSPSKSSPSQSRARLNRAPSEDPIYSPDLNTSPAFDLMPLEEAQRSPVGSPASHPPNPWTESFGDRASYEYPATQAQSSYLTHTGGGIAGSHATENSWHQGALPAPPGHNGSTGEVPAQLRSNNPFLKPRTANMRQNSLDSNDWNDRHSHTTASSDPLSQTEGYIPMTARLSLLNSSEQQESPWADHEHSHAGGAARPISVDPPHDPSPWGSQHSIKISAPQEIYLKNGQINPYAPAAAVESSDSQAGGSYGLQPPHAGGRLGLDAGINTPSMISTATSATSHELIDLEIPSGALGSESGFQQGQSSVYASDEIGGKGEKTQLDSRLPTRDLAHDRAPPLPSRNLSPAEVARQKEQRAETYSIRQINWTNREGTLLQSPILVQNKNGPCPLLALINALVLRADPNSQPPIVRALKSREQISLGLLIEALFEELTTCLGPDEEFPDIEALTQFLTMLHTGMNVNPRLTLENVESLGTFLQTPDLRSYSTFGVPLIHGWLASWSGPEHTAMTRIAQFHEDIQLLPFRKLDLEDRIMRGESLTQEEEQIMADIQAIQNFVDIENATQLSPFGLTQLSTRLAPGSVSILFRNDHFSTLYKHPQSHQLFTLVTDAGYANHAEVVWESLVDVTGFNSEFLAGDFRAVGHGPSSSAGPTSPADPHTSSAAALDAPSDREATQGPLTPQEQSDADYAYALSLQFQEEEQRERTESQQNGDTGARSGTENGTGNGTGRGNRNSVPVRLTGPAARMDHPPARTSSTGLRTRPPQGNEDAGDPNAPPPPYEHAANGPRQSPPDRRPTFDDIQIDPHMANNRNSRNRYSQPTLNTNRHSYDRTKNKDCIMM